MKQLAFAVTVGSMVVAAGQASGDLFVTDLFQFSANASGAAAGGQLWDTRTGGSFAIWVSVNGTPINGTPDTGDASIDHKLAPGSHVFEIWGQPGSASAVSFGATNLFFNGSIMPGISVFAEAMNDPMTTPSFFANASPSTLGPGGGVAGAGSLSYSDAGTGYTVTLVDYFFANPAAFGVDTGIGNIRTPGGGADFYGGFTLRVIPSPATSVALLGLGGALARRRR